jgi:hypothetical protein
MRRKEVPGMTSGAFADAVRHHGHPDLGGCSVRGARPAGLQLARSGGESTPDAHETSRARDHLGADLPVFPVHFALRGLWQAGAGGYADPNPRERAMSLNTFGHLYRVTTWGESHGPAIGCTVDGCPPGVALTEADIQPWLDRRKPGQNKFTTQRKEPDEVRILSGVYEGRTTGTPIQLMIENTDQRSKDYGEIAQSFRPGHADITYHQKYGLRDPRGGGRSSARETASPAWPPGALRARSSRRWCRG